MSLKVPKNGQMQLFKEGYKVRTFTGIQPGMLILALTDHVGS
jgi:hypothetical protein